MVRIIPKTWENIWDVWNVRGAILLSFSVQMFLFLFAPFRKRSHSLWLQFFIWNAYMLADWAANFTMGLISKNTANGDDDKETLLALWAPFVLLHFGGPETITAFSLEDNQLWLRKVPSLLFQVGASGYVFLLTLPRNTLWVPTLLVSVAGIIKCYERTRSLYIASKTLDDRTNPAVQSLEASPSEDEVASYFTDMKPLADEVAKQFPKASDLWLCTLNESDFPNLEVILESIYESHYTKAPVLWSKVGRVLRVVVFSSMVVALGVFSSMQKPSSTIKFDKVDVTITYTLFCGALLLEIITLLKAPIMFIRLFLVECSTRWSDEDLGCGQKFFLSSCLRPWSRSISGQNLIRLYLRKCDESEKPYPAKFLKGTLDRIANYLGVKQVLELSKTKTKTPFHYNFWCFIFKIIALSRATNIKYDTSLKQRLTRAEEGIRKDVVDTVMNHIINPFMNRDEYPFGRVLTLLHIVTSLCYANKDDDHNDVGGLSRERSKAMSDYMMYLYLMQPDMLSELPGIEGAWTQETMVVESIASELMEFFRNHGLTSRDHRHDEEEACRRVLSSQHYYDSSSSSSPPYPTVLVLARTIAQELEGYQQTNLKWEAIAFMWEQMLMFAAMRCRPSIHVKHLAKGGELISLVWLAASWEIVLLRYNWKLT